MQLLRKLLGHRVALGEGKQLEVKARGMVGIAKALRHLAAPNLTIIQLQDQPSLLDHPLLGRLASVNLCLKQLHNTPWQLVPEAEKEDKAMQYAILAEMNSTQRGPKQG